MDKSHKKKIKLIISILLSFAILFLIYKRIDFAELGQVFLHIETGASVIFLILIVIQLIIASWRWNIITRDMGKVNLPFFVSMEQVVGSYSANLIIPGKLGEIVRLPWMRKYATKTPVALMVLFEKLLDIAGVVFILFFSLFLLKLIDFQFPFNINSIFYITTGIVVLMLLVFIFKKPLAGKMKRWHDKKEKREDVTSLANRMVFTLSVIDRRSLVYFSITILLWFIQVLQFYFIFSMIGVEASFFYIFSGSCLALLAGALPVSVAGLGTRDAVIIGFFSPYAPLETLAGAGIISLMRVVIPALTGLPFFIRQTKNS